MDEQLSGGVTNVLMVVAVIAVVVSVFGVISTLNLRGSGFASSSPGNVTLEIQQVIELNFTRNLINWSSGFVNTSCGTSALLDTNNTVNPIICGQGWVPQTTGLILTTLGSSLPIAINLSSNQNASTLIDAGGSLSSAFRWKVQEYNITGGAEPLTCDATLTPLAYTDIVANQNVKICNQTQYAVDRNELRIDFQVKISQFAPAQTGYRTAIITATGFLP